MSVYVRSGAVSCQASQFDNGEHIAVDTNGFVCQRCVNEVLWGQFVNDKGISSSWYAHNNILSIRMSDGGYITRLWQHTALIMWITGYTWVASTSSLYIATLSIEPAVMDSTYGESKGLSSLCDSDKLEFMVEFASRRKLA